MMVVVYDAAGVRRQAGLHAAKINRLINEFFAGHPISENQLKEVLGHTPREVIGGVGLGLVVSVAMWLIWH
jgi:acid phosphatase family membrane protein YuiD